MILHSELFALTIYGNRFAFFSRSVFGFVQFGWIYFIALPSDMSQRYQSNEMRDPWDYSLQKCLQPNQKNIIYHTELRKKVRWNVFFLFNYGDFNGMEFVQNSHGPLIVIKLKRYKFVYKFWSEKKPALAGKYICLQVKEQIRKLYLSEGQMLLIPKKRNTILL